MHQSKAVVAAAATSSSDQAPPSMQWPVSLQATAKDVSAAKVEMQADVCNAQ